MAAPALAPTRPASPGVHVRPAWPALVTGLVALALMILWAGRGTTFLGDEWGWVFNAAHPSAGTFLRPDNGHLLAFTQAFDSALLRLAGLGHYVVFRLGAVLVHLVVAAAVFVLAHRRLGDRPALVPALLMAGLGTGADAFVTAINTGVLAATAAGLCALIALERDSRRGDLAACALLVLALASWTSAVAFTAGVLVEVVLRPAGRRRVWVAVIPALLYAGWRLHWAGGLLSDVGAGHGAPGVFGVIGHAFQALTGAVAGVAGIQLFSPSLHTRLPWLSAAAQAGVGLGLIVLIALGATRGRRSAVASPRLAGLAVNGLILWLLIGVARGGLGDTYASRYVYAGAVIVVLLVVEVLARVGVSSRWCRALAGATAVSLALNLVWMVVWANHLRAEAAVAKAQLAALDAAGPATDPRFAPAPREFALADVTAGKYFAARRRFGGDPADSPSTLLEAPEAIREAADRVFVSAAGPRLTPAAIPSGTGGVAPVVEARSHATASPAAGCVNIVSAPGAAGSVDLVARSRLALRATSGSSVLVVARRWADRFSVGIGGVPAGGRAMATVPALGVGPPWRIRLYVKGAVIACTAG